MLDRSLARQIERVAGDQHFGPAGRRNDDPAAVASQFNWLIMGEPLNSAMLLGDESIPNPATLRRHAAAGVRVFLASYGK
ncbi:TetR/AcrR family transcriptional regulator C-terminal domain-containing protein [Mesorhizobium sp. M0621]|uniref:TetR/AcrR family transcriptional regulator C-terminal domain-containing protein n=1 Tax=Mesorhizobium sp. M0621 TaxID=2956974 RepID=UPI0033375CAF